jgi:YfiH family protein
MIEVVQVPAWQQYAWLRHGFSTRPGGCSTTYREPSLNLGWTSQDDPAHVAENRRLLLETIAGSRDETLITLRQIHTTDIHVIRDPDAPLSTGEGRALLAGDGLASDLPGTWLGIQTADCVPIMLVDPIHRAVAVLHAGWRGTAASMAEHGVARMAQEYGSRPEDLLAAIGPSIGPCCYTVGGEVHGTFTANFPYGAELFGQTDELHLNLWEANRRQLLGSGLSLQQINVIGECTGCTLTRNGQRKYFSHRIDCGITGRMMSVIGVLDAG